MHCIDDEPNGLFIYHSGTWAAPVRLAWYQDPAPGEPGPAPPPLRECWCDGRDLVAGRFTPTSGPPGQRAYVPPVDVITRAVALAVEDHIRRRMELAVGALFINRGAS